LLIATKEGNFFWSSWYIIRKEQTWLLDWEANSPSILRHLLEFTQANFNGNRQPKRRVPYMLRTLLALGCVRVIEHEQICQMLRIASHSYTCFVGCAKRSSVDSFFFFFFSILLWSHIVSTEIIWWYII
jgi:hypothetical protein